MSLSTLELGKLQYHGANHYNVNQLLPDFEAISAWYDSVPSGVLKDLVALLSPVDRQKYFAFTDFPIWYSSLCQKINNDTTVKIFNLTNEEINTLSIQLLTDLIEYSLTEHSMQQLVQHIMKRKLNSTLDALLKCLGANGDFTEYTLFILAIDMQPYKRWQSLGLSQCPSIEECTTVFGG